MAFLSGRIDISRSGIGEVRVVSGPSIDFPFSTPYFDKILKSLTNNNIRSIFGTSTSI